MIDPRTDLKRRALLAGATGVVLVAMDVLALKWRSGRRTCGPKPPPQGSGTAPAAMWPGYTTSNSVLFGWWPPAEATPDSYNVYKDGKQIYAGVTLDTKLGGIPQLFFIDVGLAPSTSHSYHVTAVTAGVESQPSTAITMTTLAGSSTPPTPPAAPPDPATWMQAYSLPRGTVWTATNTANNNAAGTGTSNATGCGLQYAFSNANIAGGDVIVVTAGATYMSPNAGWQIPAFTGVNGWTYIISSEDPGYKAHGALPAYSYSTAGGGGNYVTPANIGAMPTLSYKYGNTGLCMQIAAGCSKVRFVGVNFQPAASLSSQLYYCVLFALSSPTTPRVPADHVYFDRCVLGNDTANLTTTFSYVAHGIGVNCNHFLLHQCYLHGFAVQGSSADSNAVYAVGGGPHCIENCYIESVSEGVLYGGGFVAQDQIPHDIVYRYNFNTKLAAWQANDLGRGPKNHFELKVGQRVECYGNIHQNNWVGVASQGQRGRSFVLLARDQVSGNSTNPITRSCPWVRVTDINCHDNQIYNVNSAGYIGTSDFCASTYTARVRFANNLIFINPGTDTKHSTGNFFGFWLGGACADVIIDHNTLIMNPSSPNAYGISAAIWNVGFGQGSGGYGNPKPYSPNPMSRAQDRVTITNNIFDGTIALAGDGIGGAGALKTSFTNYTWNKNLTINDSSSSYPETTYAHVPHTSVGFANWQGSTAQPAHASDWNVTSGTYAKASTTGGPIGATFSTSSSNSRAK